MCFIRFVCFKNFYQFYLFYAFQGVIADFAIAELMAGGLAGAYGKRGLGSTC
jgi:hypothetical protein